MHPFTPLGIIYIIVGGIIALIMGIVFPRLDFKSSSRRVNTLVYSLMTLCILTNIIIILGGIYMLYQGLTIQLNQ